MSRAVTARQTPPAGVWGNYGNQVATSTGLAENHPSGLSYAATPSVNNPRCVAIFINDLFDFFWLYAVAGNVLTVVVVPLRLQLPESYSLRLPQRTASFDSSNVAIEPRRLSGVGLELQRYMPLYLLTERLRISDTH